MSFNSNLRDLIRFSNEHLNPQKRRALDAFEYLNEQAANLQEVNELLSEWISSASPVSIVRPGATEAEGLLHFLTKRSLQSKNLEEPYPRRFRRDGPKKSGITFENSKDLDDFCSSYLQALRSASVVGFGKFNWGALREIQNLQRLYGTPVTAIRNLEAFQALNENLHPWTQSLAKKKVLVIHPFANSIRNQHERISSISGVASIMPDFDLITLVPPVKFAGAERKEPWLGNFELLRDQVSKVNFDVALIGAGSFGLPIATEIARLGKTAIHLGASLQLLFGIRGQRWADRPEISRYFDNTWISPSPDERPPAYKSHEGGAYW